MYVRGIRGATTVTENNEQEILDHTATLLQEIINKNEIRPEEIASLMITVTQDLNAAFPAAAIRKLPGWERVPLMCSVEIDVPGGLPKCVRLMLLVNTEKAQDEIVHVYLNEAVCLRPDLVEE